MAHASVELTHQNETQTSRRARRSDGLPAYPVVPSPSVAAEPSLAVSESTWSPSSKWP
jgi:hypothetical protein